ncbi:MAG: Zn-ribbon domain-containing OB-fold protein [Chloroflexota bacterium]
MTDHPPELRSGQEIFQFAGTGEVYSYTVLQDAPAGFEDQAPYVLALVKLDEGPILTAQLTDVDGEPAIGDRVEMVTRRLTTEGNTGMIVYGYKFRHVLPRSQ